jgi:nucleobase:cation symporter-1, NCS1 family
MEHRSSSKIARFAQKLAVKAEPGLTTAQLMLTNEDLKPGMRPALE